MKKFLNFLKRDGFKRKTSAVTENFRIREIDDCLEENESVLAHKLCGAGNGGFFLTFSQKNSLTLPYDCVRINAVSDGVLGESI